MGVKGGEKMSECPWYSKEKEVDLHNKCPWPDHRCPWPEVKCGNSKIESDDKPKKRR